MIPTNDPTLIKQIEAAAKANVAANEWVTSPPMLDELQALLDNVPQDSDTPPSGS